MKSRNAKVIIWSNIIIKIDEFSILNAMLLKWLLLRRNDFVINTDKSRTVFVFEHGESSLMNTYSLCNTHWIWLPIFQIVKMLVVLIVIFGVCWLPYHTYFLYVYHYPEVRKTANIQHYFWRRFFPGRSPNFRRESAHQKNMIWTSKRANK